ncbi:MAG: hypothetical protein ACE37J_02710 [Pikeienuella sp.]|uniref:hypothetical protein n=1 Tax=Pikeienuella sp. TaxID=2831957 RepID=UPI00391D309E
MWMEEAVEKALRENDIDALEREAFEAAQAPRPDVGFGLRETGPNLANRIAHVKRRVVFNLKALGGFDGARMASAGGGWFHYPVILSGVFGHLSGDADKFIPSCGDAADNDVRGEGRLERILKPPEPGDTVRGGGRGGADRCGAGGVSPGSRWRGHGQTGSAGHRPRLQRAPLRPRRALDRPAARPPGRARSFILRTCWGDGGYACARDRYAGGACTESYGVTI